MATISAQVSRGSFITLSRKSQFCLLVFFIKISENTERRRKRASEQLRADLSTGKARGDRRLYIEFPRDSDHANYFLGQVWLFNKWRGITQPLNFVTEYTKQNES